MGSLLIRGGTFLQVMLPPEQPLRRAEMRAMPAVTDGYMFVRDGLIERIGHLQEAPASADQVIDGTGRYILPCWCDSHTHLVFAASREEEFVDRIHGLSYEEIAARGGGILNSAAKLRSTSEDALFGSASTRLREIIGMGTGAVEIKSGYGLSVDSELKMLRVIRRLKESFPIPVRATFLGAHAIPMEYKHDREGYLKLLTDELLPVIADEGLADYIDVFSDRGFFSVGEAERILEAGARYGLRPKIHVSQLANIGGVQMGVRHHALTVDHLECAGEEEIALLASSATIATLLPSCAFFLNAPYPPARELLDNGAAVALATDYNPGSTPSGNMPFVIALACIQMRMTPEEAVNAATINGAFAMDAQDEAGIITAGRAANLIITRPIPSLAYIPYAFGSDHIEQVLIRGEAQ